MTYNEVPLKLPGCASNLCTAEEFLTYMESILYKGDLEQACLKKFEKAKPPTQQQKFTEVSKHKYAQLINLAKLMHSPLI